MRTSGRFSLVCLLGAVALVGAGCDESNVQPTEPEAVQAVVAHAPGKSQKTPYITNLELPSGNTLYVSDGGAGWFVVSMTNPGPKTATGIFWQAVLEQNGLIEFVGSDFLYCYQPAGSLPSRGSCTHSSTILARWPTQFARGPALFSVKLMQRNIDNSIKELDRVTLNVVIDY